MLLFKNVGIGINFEDNIFYYEYLSMPLTHVMYMYTRKVLEINIDNSHCTFTTV